METNKTFTFQLKQIKGIFLSSREKTDKLEIHINIKIQQKKKKLSASTDNTDIDLVTLTGWWCKSQAVSIGGEGIDRVSRNRRSTKGSLGRSMLKMRYFLSFFSPFFLSSLPFTSFISASSFNAEVMKSQSRITSNGDTNKKRLNSQIHSKTKLPN